VAALATLVLTALLALLALLAALTGLLAWLLLPAALLLTLLARFGLFCCWWSHSGSGSAAVIPAPRRFSADLNKWLGGRVRSG